MTEVLLATWALFRGFLVVANATEYTKGPGLICTSWKWIYREFAGYPFRRISVGEKDYVLNEDCKQFFSSVKE